jgi:hypothetical protein
MLLKNSLAYETKCPAFVASTAIKAAADAVSKMLLVSTTFCEPPKLVLEKTQAVWPVAGPAITH